MRVEPFHGSGKRIGRKWIEKEIVLPSLDCRHNEDLCITTCGSKMRCIIKMA